MRPANSYFLFTPPTVATDVNRDITFLEYPQFSSTVVETSVPKVIGSLRPYEKFTARVYNQVHQEQIAAGETTQNIVETPVVKEQVIVQEIFQAPQIIDPLLLLEDVAAQIDATVQQHVIFQEIPQVQVMGRIQEQIVEPIEVLPHERVQQFTVEQIVHLLVPQTQEQCVVTELANRPISITAVEFVDSFSVSEDVATLADVTTLNTSSTSTSSSNRAVTTPNTIEVLSSSSTSTSRDRVDELSSKLDSWMETPLPVPPLVEPPSVESTDRTSAKRRRRTRYTPLPGIMENGVCLAPVAAYATHVISHVTTRCVEHERGENQRAS